MGIFGRSTPAEMAMIMADPSIKIALRELTCTAITIASHWSLAITFDMEGRIYGLAICKQHGSVKGKKFKVKARKDQCKERPMQMPQCKVACKLCMLQMPRQMLQSHRLHLQNRCCFLAGGWKNFLMAKASLG